MNYHAAERLAASFAQEAAHQDGSLVKRVVEACRALRNALELTAEEANTQKLADAARDALDALDNFVADEITGGLAFVAQSRGEELGINLGMEAAVLAIYETTPDKEDMQ